MLGPPKPQTSLPRPYSDTQGNEELQVLLFNLPKDQARRSLVASRYKGLARRELLEELFAALSEGPELPPSQLRRLAELTGASSLRGESGMTRAQFVRVLEDDGQTSTDMLRQALLTVRGEALISGKPWSRRSFVQTWRRSDVANMDRPSMIEAIFATLDQSKSGVLDSDRIRAYAEQTGFEGTDGDWAEQFAAMCQHFGWVQDEGITQSQFRELVEDDDETDDDELRQALLNLQMQPGTSGRASVVGSSWQRKSLLHLPSQDFAANMSRPDIISAIFSLLDTAGHAKLLSAQLKQFAISSGFEGDADEWSSQFDAMCEHFGWNVSEGISKAQFVEFVGDEVEHSDDELRRVLVSLQAQRRNSMRHSVSSHSWSRRSFVQTWRRSDVANMDRPSMIEAIFATLDQSKSGVLDSDRIRAYAEQTGFEGTDGDWAEQFAAMCQHFGWVQDEGITQSQFRELVEDDDETDDDELRQALLNLQMQPGTSGRASVVGSSWQRKRSFVQTWRMSDVANMDRPSMIEAIFTTLDKRRSGVLDSEHIRAYAEQTGFEGTAGDWAEQFAAMCQHFGWAQGEGITQSQFRELVEDDDETDDDELRQALLNLQMQPETSSRASVVGSSWQRKSLLHLPSQDFAANMSRPDIISAIFSLLDTAGHAKLFSAQLKQFAISSGFEGDADEWSSQFDAMCAHFGWNVSEGISKAQFVEFVGDEVEHSDDELRRVLVSLAQR